MNNRIRRISIFQARLDPAEAELWVSVYPEQLTSTTVVRGRLMGPRCQYASTVEVAYPLREHSRQYEKEGEPRLIMRVIIPEPSLWEPETPFLYQGPVELWQKGQGCDEVQLSHGLREFRLSPQGIRWNGRILSIRGVERSGTSEQDALELRRAGCNALLAPVSSVSLWQDADRFGFLMLGRMMSRSQFQQAHELWRHPCCLGWVLDAKLLEDPLGRAVGGNLGDKDHLMGVELDQKSATPLPAAIRFVLCPENALPALAEIGLPKLVRKEVGSLVDEGAEVTSSSPGILGWIWA